jgi:flagellar biosynthetic protein FlhB
MAGGEDKESRTEEATEKKIADALERGDVPRSREITIFASMLGMLAAAAFLIGPRSVELAKAVMTLIDHPGGFALETGPEVSQLLWAVSLQIGAFLVPIVGTLMLAGIAAAVFQHAPSFAVEQIKPKWSRISPVAGWNRLFGAPGLVEFGKALFKFTAIGFVCVVLMSANRSAVIDVMFADPGSLPEIILSLVMRLVSAVCTAIVLMVVGDILWSRYKWRVDLRMTRQEVKDEMKQSEGDPLVKSRLRSLARDRARRRMIAAVPKATVVIANPTHYAVALKYDRSKGGAPLVVAKGVDLVALRIREIASRHSVPIVEDRPLARALYEAVEVDHWIPPEFYRAVAKILHFLYSRPVRAIAG